MEKPTSSIMADDNDDFRETMMAKTNGRRTYLVTYAKADLNAYPTRKSFGEMVESYFNRGWINGKTTVKVEYFAVCKEKHADESDHYHAAIKLTGVKKWAAVKQAIYENENVNLHFGEDHSGYLKAYRYIAKEDSEVYESPGHPEDLIHAPSPRTSKCIEAYRKRRRSTTPKRLSTEVAESPSSSSSSKKETPNKVARMSNVDVSDMIFKQQIQTLTQLYALANTRKEAGQGDLANYVLSRDDKLLAELIRKTYLLKDSSGILERQKLTRLEVIRMKAAEECVEGCDGLWLECALEVLEFNRIHPIIFGTAVRDLMIQGRGKYRNIIIVGERNCAKTFILKPLELIFNCFVNPAKDKYAWVGVDKCEVILLQDYRWDSETIAWKNLLLLLEGELVHLPAPKNHFVTDISVSSDIPIFATSKEKIKFKGPNNTWDEKEDRMMDCRWKLFQFIHEFSEENQKTIPPCGQCFSKLTLMGDMDQ